LWNPQQTEIAMGGLRDIDPYVQRAAADAFGRHAAADHIRPLLDLRQRVPPEDAQLLQVARMALRNQLLPEGTLTRVQSSPLSEQDSRAIADAALGLKSAEAGKF